MKRSFEFSGSRAMLGVGLIEVLISILVLAVGILGLAALQSVALKNSQSSLERSNGLVNTYAILDAMRANVSAARSGGYDMAWACTAPTVSAGSSMATQDQAAWINLLQKNLNSSACGMIDCTTTPSMCTIGVQWNDERAKGGQSVQQMIPVQARL